jgi:hypothetical protein
MQGGMRSSITLRIAAVVASAIVLGVLFLRFERPRFLRWGATDAEIARAYPGDQAVPDAREVVTRAVTIAAPRSRVWPWVAQLGQDRAGFYSYAVLEDLAGYEMPSMARILFDHQAWQPGDRLWMYPARKLDGVGGAPLVSYEPGRHLLFATRQIGAAARAPEDATWGFYLDSLPDGATRLIARGRTPAVRGALACIVNRGLFEPAHYVMERRMLRNIRALAEGRTPSNADSLTSVLAWTLTVLLMFAAILETFRRAAWLRPLAVAWGAALLFQFLTFEQPPALIGVFSFFVLAAVLVWPAPPPLEEARA